MAETLNDTTYDIPPSSPTLPTRPSRKRDYASSNSSDVPFFSSDDLAEASLTSYSPERRKRQHRRHWWDGADRTTSLHTTPEPAQPGRRRRNGRRPKDSGIYMSSEASSGEDGFNVEDLKGALSSKNDKARRIFWKEPPSDTPSGEKFVERIVDKCLENGGDTVDLGSCGLTSIPSRLLRPLRDLIQPPRFDGNHQDERYYHTLAPDLKVVLSSNKLEEVPGEIFNLENLTMLSIRNNRIKEIPPSVGKLRKLTELNVTSNLLRYLPWEILPFIGAHGNLALLTYSSNPLLQPTESRLGLHEHFDFGATLEEAVSKTQELIQASNEAGHESIYCLLLKIHLVLKERMCKYREPPSRSETRGIRITGSPLPVWKTEPVYVGSSPKAFFELDGTLARGSPQAPSAMPQDVKTLPIAHPYDQASQPKQHVLDGAKSKVPSLFETALRASRAAAATCSLLEMLPENAPTHVVNGVRLAEHIAERGCNRCSVCQCDYVAPRAEWIEYWHLRPQHGLSGTSTDLVTPFLRRTCSWMCALSVQCTFPRPDREKGIFLATAS